MLTTIERVLLLRRIDTFADVSTENLAELAQISEEISRLQGDILFREGSLPDSFYLIVDGQVDLVSDSSSLGAKRSGEALGTWALFDDEPHIATATVSADARLIRIRQSGFRELLADHPEIAEGVLRTLARKFRGLGRVRAPKPHKPK